MRIWILDWEVFGPFGGQAEPFSAPERAMAAANKQDLVWSGWHEHAGAWRPTHYTTDGVQWKINDSVDAPLVYEKLLDRGATTNKENDK